MNAIHKITDRLIDRLGLPQVKKKSLNAFLSKYQAPSVELKRENFPFSVIIPCYSHAEYLPQTLLSLKKQIVSPDEIIFINDKSPDNSSFIIHEFIKQNQGTSKVVLVENEQNLGQAESINKAVRESFSEVFMILNDDDYLFPDAVKIAKSIFNKFNDIHLLGATSCWIQTNSEIKEYLTKILANRPKETCDNLTWHPAGASRNYSRYNDLNMTHSSSVFSKIAFTQVGGYFKNHGERLVPFSDRDFQLRVNCFFRAGILNETPLSCWRMNSSVDRDRNS